MKRDHYGYSCSYRPSRMEYEAAWAKLTEEEKSSYIFSSYGGGTWHAVLDHAHKIINTQGKEGRYDFLTCVQAVSPNLTHYREETHTQTIRYLLTHRTVNNVMLRLIKQNPSLLFQEWRIKLSKTLMRTILYEIDDDIQELVDSYKKTHADYVAQSEWNKDARDMNLIRFMSNLKMLSEEEQVYLRLKWGI